MDRYMVSAPTKISYPAKLAREWRDKKLSTDLHWRINYIQCCVPLILKLWNGIR